MACSSLSSLRLLLHPNRSSSSSSSSNGSLVNSFLVSSQSLARLKRELRLSSKNNHFTKRRRCVPIVAAQSNFLRVLQTVWRVGKDGIEAGTRLVPDFVPRPIARVSVAGVGGLVSLFLLKSILSTAFFVLAMMGLIYSIYIAWNKDEGPRNDGGTRTTEDTLEEARRIMEKYK